MAIKTTFNIKLSQVYKISRLSEELNCSKSWIINSIFRKIFKSNSFKIRFLLSVKYQNRINDKDSWKHFPVCLDGDIYEKCQDMRKLFKLSVSFILSEAIDRYLNDLKIEFCEGKNSDNYTPNYILFYTKSEYYTQISIIWGMMENKELNQLYQLHSKH